MCHIGEPNEFKTRRMFDNFLLNMKSFLPANRSVRRQSVRDENTPDDECAVMFIEGSPSVQRLGFIRSYFNRLTLNGNACELDSFMLPRVYGANDWDAIELKPQERYIDDLDNVVDKFIRVTSGRGVETATNLPFHV